MQTNIDRIDGLAAPVAARNGRWKTLLGGSIGHFIEWFD